MNSNKKIILVFVILEGEKANTERNFFEGFSNCIKDYYKKINFIPPWSLNGDSKDKENLLNKFLGKLKSNIEFTTNQKFNNLDNIYIFFIWDKNLKKNTNFEKNYNFIKQKIKEKNIKCNSIISNESIEKGLFCKFFGKNISLEKLTKKMEYENNKIFKKESNKHLFYNIMKKTEIKTDCNLIQNMRERLLEHDLDNDFIKLLDLIEK